MVLCEELASHPECISASHPAWDRLQVHHNPDQEEMFTEDERTNELNSYTLVEIIGMKVFKGTDSRRIQKHTESV